MSATARFPVLASYPKSGSTWLRAALESLRKNGAPIDINANLGGVVAASDRRLFDRVTGLCADELSAREIIRARPHVWTLLAARSEPRPWIKCHDALLRPYIDAAVPLPCDRIGPIIYIARDPRDVAVSLADHFSVSIDAAIAYMADRDAFLNAQPAHWSKELPQFLSSWSAHVQSWLDAANGGVHVVRYEDMHTHPRETFGAAAQALGISFDTESLDRAICSTAFRILRAQEDASGFREREPAAHRFFRRGIVGGWRDSLTATQAQDISSYHEELMIRLGYGEAA